MALTRRGVALAARLAAACCQELAGQAAGAVPAGGSRAGPDREEGVRVHLYRFGRAGPGGANCGPVVGHRFTSLRELAPRLVQDYTLVVFVAAAGVAVRALAPHLRGKRQDPAVLVVDEEGRFVVSLLGGHRRDGNRWARVLARFLGAVPVITTASEIYGLPPLETTGAEHGWRLENDGPAVARVAGALLNGEPVGAYLDPGLPPLPRELAARLVRLEAPGDLARQDLAAAVVVSDRELPGLGAHREDWLVFRPPTLAVGVGCARGVGVEELARAFQEVLRRYGLARASVALLASIDRKREEGALLAFADREGLPLRFYGAAELAAVPGLPNPSEVVRRVTGVPGVCEPAAVLAAGGGGLLVPKETLGRVTLAVARNPAGIRPGGGVGPAAGGG